jgi:NitT/TauT family transport system substrate-binding protein
MSTRPRGPRPRAIGVALAVLALIVAACGDGDEATDTTVTETTTPTTESTETTPETTEPTDTTVAEEMVSLIVGDILGTPAAFSQFVVDQGFFDEQGLDVTIEPNPGGAANIPGVEAGDFQIAGSNVVSILLARSQGLELKMVSAGTFATAEQDTDFSLVLVPPDSDIQGPEDLNGRSVAVNTLANIAEVTIRASLENAGAEHEDIDFVEMGFPDMVPAALAGDVDAVHVIEPFMSIGLGEGMRAIIAPYAGTRPNVAIGSYFSSDSYIAENPDVIDRFVAAVSAGGAYVADNHDEFRQALVDIAGIDPAVAEGVNIPPWGGPVDVESVQLIGDYMVQFGLLDEVPPIEDVVYSP